jgi:D-amino-acid dehydrogenase
MKKIAVIGAGVIGITTAYELALKGHSVTLFDQHSACAEEASFANGSIFSPNFVTPWLGPGLPKLFLHELFKAHAPVRLSGVSFKELSWIRKWRSACKLDNYLSHRSQLHSLAQFSAEVLKETTLQLGLEYEHTSGLTVLFRSAEERKSWGSQLQIYKEMGILVSEITSEAARALEPALSSETTLHSGLHFERDGVVNCRQFALLLKEECERLGVRFEFNSPILPLSASAPTTLVQANHAKKFDDVVICAGTSSSKLLSHLGLKIPLLPVYGYTLSAAIKEPLDAPLSAVFDHQHKVTICKMGQRIRVSGIAQLGAPSHKQSQLGFKTLYKVLSDWFPGGSKTSERVQEWTGARACLPEGVPIIGSTKIPGVWLNMGHGASGWTLSCGAANALASMIHGELPKVNMVGFSASKIE